MTTTVDVPRGVKVAILQAAAAAQHPTLALPTIAAHHSLTLAQVKSVVEAHGWPRPDSMRRAATILARRKEADEPGDDGRDVYSEISIELLHPDPDNVRDNLGGLTELMDSMVSVGLLQPIVARRHQGRLFVVAGHRRLAAAKNLRWTEVPCLVKSGIHPDQVLGAMLIENGQRKDLDPIEEARGLRALKDREHITDVQLGLRVARSQAYVSGRLALLLLSPSQQADIRAGTMTLAKGTTTGRKRAGTHQPAGHASTGYLSETHPLADTVAALCRSKGHHKKAPGRVGKIACGRCWEDVIRSDERTRMAAK